LAWCALVPQKVFDQVLAALATIIMAGGQIIVTGKVILAFEAGPCWEAGVFARNPWPWRFLLRQ
jgi:hypothetical protein